MSVQRQRSRSGIAASAGDMKRVAGERRTPGRFSLTCTSDIDRIAVALTLDEIPHALAGNPAIARKGGGGPREPFKHRIAGGLRFRWLRWSVELTVVPPVTEAPNANVAAARCAACVQRKIRAPRTLERRLCGPGVTKDSLRVHGRLTSGPGSHLCRRRALHRERDEKR